MKLIPFVYIIVLLFSGAVRADTVLLVGDSIGAGYGLEEHQRWANLLENKLRKSKPDLDVINASISGDTTSGGLQRLPAALTRFSPDIVIIELGGNDGLRGYPVKQMQKNLEAMSALANEAGAQVLIAGMLIPSNYGAAYLQRFADAFVTAAQNTDATLLPFLLEPIATDRGYFQADGIHPNAEAQPLIAEHILQSLAPMLEAVTSG
jgi:acyl-CoA thioesterase-1